MLLDLFDNHVKARSATSKTHSLEGDGTIINDRGKKITCPGALDKLNFRQDKHIFSPNVRWASKKFNASIFDNIFRTSYLATGQVKILPNLPGGQVKILRFFYP